MQKITPFLWFENKAEEAARFYVSVFKNSKIGSISRYDEAGAKASGQPKGAVMVVAFNLDGVDFMAINGGPVFKFSPATSFVVNCNTQEEIHHFWGKLSEGGKTNQCGWLDDKFGVTWQVVPTVLGELMGGKDPKKSQRVMEAMLKMTKMDIAALQRAYDGAK